MRRVLQNADFRRLWCSQIGLALGDGVMQMGLLELFRTQARLDPRIETAKLFFASALPAALLGPLAIAYLDRFQRRSVLMCSDSLRALVMGAMVAWVFPIVSGRWDPQNLLVIYAMVFVIGAITTFYYPARYALIPNLVGTDKLIQANTLFTTSLAVAGVGSRALGGFIAEQLGVEWALLCNAFAYVSAVALVWNIRMTPHATTTGAAAHAQGGWGELKTGLVYLWQHRTALPLVLLSAVFAFLAGVFVVAIVGYALDTLGLRTGGVGYLIAAAGIGATAGVAVFGRGRKWTHATWLPFVQLLLVGLLLVVLSTTTGVWLAALFLVALGACGATMLIPIDAKLQEHVDDQRRGAVFAARGMLTSATMVVAFWLNFGTPLLRRTPAPTILLWLGAVSVIVSALAAMAVRTRRG